MSEARTKADWSIVAALVLAAVLVSLAVYAAGYFAMAKGFELGAVGAYRYYDSEWKAQLFVPAARVESVVTGRRVSTMSTDAYNVFP